MDGPSRGHRRSIRLPGWDYTLAGAYFVTICTWQKQCVLGHVDDDNVRLSSFGTIVDACLRNIPASFPNMKLDSFIIMPNHVHLIILIGDDGQDTKDSHLVDANNPNGCRPQSLGAAIQNFKSVSARRINRIRGNNKTPIWQRNYYERIIRNDIELSEIRKYFQDNSLRWLLHHSNGEGAEGMVSADI